MTKKIIYIDMDGTMCDYVGAAIKKDYDLNEAKHVKGFFKTLKPMPDAIDAIYWLNKHFDVYVLTTAPWTNPSAWSDKLEWIKKYVPILYKKLIITHHKELAIGDYLIDDMTKNGAGEFKGTHIQFGTEEFPDWNTVKTYFENLI